MTCCADNRHRNIVNRLVSIQTVPSLPLSPLSHRFDLVLAARCWSFCAIRASEVSVLPEAQVQKNNHQR